MDLALGIDTGGTYTDAAVVDQTSGRVLAAAKSLTTRDDLSLGIAAALDSLLAQAGGLEFGRMGLVGLSTTLATNALVEGQGCPVGLVLIGYDRSLIEAYGFKRDLAADQVVYLAGGHDDHGQEVEPLDLAGLERAAPDLRTKAEALAVSAYFSVRNPAHELEAKRRLEDLTGLPVTCGHELTSRLDSIKRATTAALNARLTPLLGRLIEAVRRVLAQRSLPGELMVVKGDGSLVRAELALSRPVETILSGPAASLVGAWHLARLNGRPAGDGSLWVMDMGGTTTDICGLSQGRPVLSPQGASLGGWRTMVRALDVHTVGLGGDSQVRLDRESRLFLGPQRVIPLCQLAAERPELAADFKAELSRLKRLGRQAGWLMARPGPDRPQDETSRRLLDRLAQGPVSESRLEEEFNPAGLFDSRIESLISQGRVWRSAFTPTDALHVLDRMAVWSVEAARLGARVLADRVGQSPEEFCQQVVEAVSSRAAAELVTKVLEDEGLKPDWAGQPLAAWLLERSLNGGSGSGLDCRLSVNRPLVAIGAPVRAYLPRAAERLQTSLIVPEHAEVASAVGAVVGSVVVQRQVTISAAPEGRIRVHLPEGVGEFGDLEEACAWAEREMRVWLKARLAEAGAEDFRLEVSRKDLFVPLPDGYGEGPYVGTEMSFTAQGRPSPAGTGGGGDSRPAGR